MILLVMQYLFIYLVMQYLLQDSKSLKCLRMWKTMPGQTHAKRVPVLQIIDRYQNRH